MADPFLRQTRGSIGITIGSTDVKAGDLLYFDGTDWEKADADDNTKHAELIATSPQSAGEVSVGCREAIIVDTDAPYTQGGAQYLSATAGAITETKPTGAENLNQVVGFALSTSEIAVECRVPVEHTISVSFPYNVNAAPQDRDNDFMGLGLDDTSAEVGVSVEVPPNAINVAVFARLWWCGTGTALDTGDTYTIDVSGGIDDETTSATQDGISAAALTVAANDLANADVSAAFDGTGLVAPGNILGIAVKKAAEGATGDDPIILSISMTFFVV